VQSTKAVIKKADDDSMQDITDWDAKVGPFLQLQLDLPPTPLYADSAERNIIPQVPLYTILHKFDGVTEQNQRGTLKKFRLGDPVCVRLRACVRVCVCLRACACVH
jgi:hypothetical protein